ncbi:MAG: LlaJI family restriction endonuclease [Tolypothrix carrinoi HA7290-LM1]|jgi:hypothetical protein|nr:LlaJI family restriction endonuclease [Tolypothrix carrinoi HA7290-LM1]
MIDFSELKLVTDKQDNFVGIRKSKSGDGFEFCLPNGFNYFPEKENFDKVRDLFFKMYRTFRKFERDNQGTNRFKKNKPEYQQEQDQTTLSSGGISIQTEDGESCVLYSKLRMIERVLEAYDDLAINSIQNKKRRSEEIDYSQIHKYLDRAIYLDNHDNHVIYVEAMDLPRPMVRYDSTDIVNLYCYILDEIVQQLDGDVLDNIQAHSQDIRFLAQCFKDDYLTSSQSIFDKDTFVETINILKEALDNIDKNTYYKDTDYWGLYEAIETFLYGELNPDQNDGEFWGIQGFSLVWEDMCHTYFFKKYDDSICFADADIPLKGDPNPARQGEEQNRVGNYKYSTDGEAKYGNQWIYRQPSHIPYPKKEGFFGWDELLCIEFDTQPGTLVYSNRNYDNFQKRDRSKAMRRFPRPDLVLKFKSTSQIAFELYVIDYKDVSIDFYYRNLNLPPEKTDEKYRVDLKKGRGQEAAMLKEQSDGDSNPNRLNPPCRRWGFIPSWLQPEG